ncbi:hypothetical protein FSP39_006125 [Pinctada imbricata]|uniref:Uncharacterized protein n=1 Tax=Pinctada imbricata TaxID=66713 RepID=A0AA88XQK5_PINIB|nr:hypothetical protein FSP39_006125 [Pinctada imbricata]
MKFSIRSQVVLNTFCHHRVLITTVLNSSKPSCWLGVRARSSASLLRPHYVSTSSYYVPPSLLRSRNVSYNFGGRNANAMPEREGISTKGIMEQDDNDNFKIQISKFHSSFDLDDAVTSEQEVSFKCKKLEEELKEEDCTREERIETNNLLSYLKWRLGNEDKAVLICDENLKMDELNIIALANKARFLRSSYRFHEAEQVLHQLQNLQNRDDFDRLQSRAKAEIAYSYSRLGPKHHGKCIELFKEALITFPENCSWKFGLAMTYRRETNILNSQQTVEGSYEEHALKALKLLVQVTTSDQSSDNLKAKAFCELGQILYGKKKSQKFFSHIPKCIGILSDKDCFRKAREISPNDPFVLQRIGRHLRHSGMLDESIECLKKARSIRETPYNLNHLALSLRSKAVNEEKHVLRTSSLNSDAQTNIAHGSTQNPSSGTEKIDMKNDLYTPPHQRAVNVKRQNQNKECQRKLPSSESHDDVAKCRTVQYPGESSKMIQYLLNSPKEIEFTIPDSPLLREAVKCLRRAVELKDGDFPQALYDLGLVFRRLDKCEEAVDAFIQSYRLPSCTKIEKVRAIEQIGICKLELSERKGGTKEQANSYYSDAKTSLFKAVSLLTGLSSLQPELENALNSFETLQSMLIEENIQDPGNVSATRELAKLHSMMGNYRDAIASYEHVKEVLLDDTPLGDISDLLTNYEKMKDFDNAILLLNWISKDNKSIIDRNQYIKVHIHAWEFNAKQRQFKKAKNYLRTCLTFALQKTLKDFEDGDGVKALIICSCDELSCPASDNIKMHLQSICDITSLRNTKDCPPGTIRFKYIEESMNKCDFILLLNSCNNDFERSKYYMDMVMVSGELRRKAVSIGNVVGKPRFGALYQIPLPESDNCDIEWVKYLLENVLINKDLK